MIRTKTRSPSIPVERPQGLPARDRVELPVVNADPLDISAQLAAAHTEVESLYRQLERLNRLASIGTIAGMIAHEFNNILTPIVTYSQLAAADPDDRELTQRALARTFAGAERAARIADAILGFVRDDSSASHQEPLFHVEQPSLAPSAHVADVVAEAIACLAPAAPNGSDAVSVQIPEALHVAISPTYLQQSLVNLILNARNAILPAGGRIEIAASRWIDAPPAPRSGADSRSSVRDPDGRSTWNDGRPGPWVCIVVRDTGRGIAPDRLARMFTPFSSDTDPTSAPRPGTGLGMVITKRLIERAGGWITVESALGRGTTTTIVLPEAATTPSPRSR